MAVELLDLYIEAEENDVDIMSVDTDVTKSMSVMSDLDNCYIGLNPLMIDTTAEEKVLLAHELGHCMTGAFYNQYSKLDIREKHERRADKWAIKKLIPVDELKRAVKSGRESRYELAEYFNVTEDFMQKAMDYYRDTK
nr:MAG TPA: IrrE protein [Caudoviricetes sp.]